MYELARGYRERGMAAYSELQQAEFASEAHGYSATRHQREVGTSYFDAVARPSARASARRRRSKARPRKRSSRAASSCAARCRSRTGGSARARVLGSWIQRHVLSVALAPA
jgi:hypothetical protein